MPGSALVLSRQDYRTDVRDSLACIARSLTETFDDVRFVSVGLSPFAARASGGLRASGTAVNTWVSSDRVQCFRWSTPWPVTAEGPLLHWLTATAIDTWAAWPCPDLDDAAKRADVIIVEFGLAAALIRRLRHRAPHAQIIIRAADGATTPADDARTRAILDRNAGIIDRVCVAARALLSRFDRFGDRVIFVPRGLDPTFYDRPSTSPYGPGRNVVAIGSPFDASVVQVAAGSLPDTHFHLIGTTGGHRFPPNVRQHGAVPFPESVPYLQHADAGIVAYSDNDASDCLPDTSFRLVQLGHLGIPAVCPNFAVGDRPLRAGYAPGRSASVRQALRNAFSMSRDGVRVPAPTWREVCDRMLGSPTAHPASPPVPRHATRVHHDG